MFFFFKTQMMKTTKKIQRLGTDFLNLFFPKLCLACRKQSVNERIICTKCELKLPETNFHLQKENQVAERFWGRIPVKHAAALYFFSKDTVPQALIHQLKYHSKPQVGVVLGEYYGTQLRNSVFNTIDCIIPVPLHSTREYKRGYNQSAKIAQGLSKSMKKPWYNDGVIRTVNTTTQTKKSKADRFENVKNAFQVSKPNLLKGKHVLLVDDVITTGATIEACALKILEIEDIKISIVALGVASDLV